MLKSFLIPKVSPYLIIVTFAFPVIIMAKGAGSDPLGWAEMSIFLLTILMFSLCFAGGKVEIHGIYRYFTMLVFAFVIYQVTLILAAQYPLAAFVSIMIHDKYFLLAFIFPILFRSETDEKVFVFILLFIAGIVCYKLLIDVYLEGGMRELYGEGGFAREDSFFPNTNMFGMFVVGMLPLLIIAFHNVRTRGKRLLVLLFIAGPLLISLLMSFSRRAWVAALLMGLIYGVTHFKVKNVIYLLIFCIWLFFVSDAYVFIDRFMLVFDSNYASNNMRAEMAYYYIRLISADVYSMLGGLGSGSVGPAYLFTSFTVIDGSRLYIDSYYMQLLIEYGLVGLLLFFSLFTVVGAMGIAAYRRYRKRKSEKSLYVYAYLLVLLAYLISGLVGSTIISFPTNCYMWLFVGLVIKHYLASKKIKEPQIATI